MAQFIEVPVLCNTSTSSELEALGIKVDDSDLHEIRTGYINRELITAFYPASTEGEVYINFSGDTITLKISIEELKKLIL